MRTAEKWDALQRSGIRRFTNLAKEYPGTVMFTLGEPDFDTPEPIKEAAKAALAAGRTHYAPNLGTDGLRKAIARYETARGNSTIFDNVMVTCGATGAILSVLLGMLQEGDEVIVPTPGFLLYDTHIAMAGAKKVALPIAHTGFQIEEEALRRCITGRTKGIILNSPNNPTGTVLNEKSLAAVKKAAVEHDLFLLVDAVYDQLCDGAVPTLANDPELKDRLFLCQSFSKPYAMTGWRCGYLVAPEQYLPKLLLLNAAMISGVPPFVQDACEAALQTDISYMQQAYKKRRDYVCRRLEAMGLDFPRPEGAFYVFPDIREFGMSSETFAERLIREAGVATVPGSCFSQDGFLRLSYCCSDADLKLGLDRLENFLTKLRGEP